VASERPERDLCEYPLFRRVEDGPSAEEYRDHHPWPTKGEALLDKAVGSEEFIYPYTEWGFWDDLQAIGNFARHYQDAARDLVREWCHSGANPDGIVYPVGFLYRHAIELHLKARITDTEWFRGLDDRKKMRALMGRKIRFGHSLKRLWRVLKPLLKVEPDKDELATVERQIQELNDLDEKSDGFRYPFGFKDKNGNRETLLEGLAKHTSFENFVWILDGIASWLSATQEVEEEHRRFEAEMRADAQESYGP
jgi:hypothetical protein